MFKLLLRDYKTLGPLRSFRCSLKFVVGYVTVVQRDLFDFVDFKVFLKFERL